MSSNTFKRLTDYIANQMQMQHIYQPVMLDALLRNRGSCAVKEIAKAFLAYDASQIDYYGEITKNMPARILGSHGIVEKEKTGNCITSYRLSGFDNLTEVQIESLRVTCKERLDVFT